MMYDLQKASLLKRASAFLLDFILLVVLATGVGMVVSAITGFDTYNDALGQRQAQYEQQYGVSFDLSQSEFAELTEEEQKKLTDAYDELAKDPDFIYNYNMVINLSLTIVSTSLLVAYLALEFVVPLLFGNGQTVGKKIFGIAVMKLSGIKVDAVSLFVRTLLLLMMLWGAIGMVGPLVIGAILVTEIVFMITSHTNAMIHDKLAQTVAVDMQSQMIFASEAELLAYKAKAHEEMVKKQSY